MARVDGARIQMTKVRQQRRGEFPAIGCLVMAIEGALVIAFWSQLRSFPILGQIMIGVIFLFVLGWSVSKEPRPMRAARRLIDQDNFTEAAQQLDAHLQSDSQDSESLYLKGICALGQGNVEEAVRIWHEAHAADPFHWKSAASLSLHYLDQGDELRACALYIEAKKRGTTGEAFEQKLIAKYGADEASRMIRQAERFYAD